MDLHEPQEEYDGPARVGGPDDGSLPVRVRLRGHFEPLDGRFHWYGRIDADDALASTYRSGAEIVLTTPHGAAPGKISDLDPWGRYRVTGTGAPPF